MKVDKTVINLLNKQNVIHIIRNNGPIFKAEIARMTGLSIPTIMKITDDLISRNLVREIGKGESRGGKPPKLLEFISDSYYIIGVDIGTTHITTIVTDTFANIISRNIISTNSKDSPQLVIENVYRSIINIMDESGVEQSKILGIGIGMPGILDSRAGKVLFSPDLGWEDIELLKPLREKIKLPIIMDNVTRAMALGEKWFGVAKNSDNYVCINLGYGIGSAIVIHGEVYGGSSSSSGELGHMILEKDGPLCSCGNYGCLEALASANAIAVRAREMVVNNKQSIIIDSVKGNLDAIDAKIVFDAAKQGDALAWKIVEEATQYIGIALANMINLLDPDLIILEGGVTQAGDILLDSVNREVVSRQMKYAGKNARIMISKLGANAVAIGAVALILKVFVENGGHIEALKG